MHFNGLAVESSVLEESQQASSTTNCATIQPPDEHERWYKKVVGDANNIQVFFATFFTLLCYHFYEGNFSIQ